MYKATVDQFRSVLLSQARNGDLVLDAVPVEGGYELICGGQVLCSVRSGEVRVFKSLDGLVGYLNTHLVASVKTPVTLRVSFQSGLL